MSISPRQLKFFWTAARKVGLNEPEIRTALARIAGVASVKELDQDGFEAMVGLFEYLGFTPSDAQGTDDGDRPGMATFAQLELIWVLWREYTDQAYGLGEDELNTWLRSSFKVSSLRFVTLAQARKVITALKAMKARGAA